MKLNERLVWALVIVLGGFYIDKQEKTIEDLEKAVSHNTDFETLNLKRQVFYSMLLNSINSQVELQDQYNDLLDIVAE